MRLLFTCVFANSNLWQLAYHCCVYRSCDNTPVLLVVYTLLLYKAKLSCNVLAE